jgi:diacylglycerol kinase (ATP)
VPLATSPYGRAVLIVDGSKGAAATGALPEVERHLRARELAYEIDLARGPLDATALAQAALERDRRFVVAVGGDGIVHGVVNGMMSGDRAAVPDAVLGVVAVGRGCDFVRTFGIPAMPGHAVAHLAGPDSFWIDLGKVTFERHGRQTTRYFANVAEAGLSARVTAMAGRLARWLGPPAYPLAFWLEVLRSRPRHVVVDLVDRTYEGPLNSLVVANGQFMGGGLKIAPRAAPTDGLLDVLVDRTPRREAIALMPRVYRGEHLPHPDIRLAKRVRASISGAQLLVVADGEILGRTPATFEVMPKALRLKV